VNVIESALNYTRVFLAHDAASDSETAAIEEIRESNRLILESNRLILIGISMQMLLFAFLFWRFRIFNWLFACSASSITSTEGGNRMQGPVPMSDVVIASCDRSSPVNVDPVISHKAHSQLSAY
jgi:hypothetical protein